jgi:hypothetical protein
MPILHQKKEKRRDFAQKLDYATKPLGTIITNLVKFRRRPAKRYNITDHKTSGFRYSEKLIEEGRWEIKAYHIENTTGVYTGFTRQSSESRSWWS